MTFNSAREAVRFAIALCSVAAGGFLVLPSARAEQGRLITTAFTARETGIGRPSWTTVQDDRGILYFGFDDVVSYDGERWTRNTVPGSYDVRALAFGPEGRLWVGATNEVGYFDRTEKGLSAYHSLVAELPAGQQKVDLVWQVFARGKGAVFVTSSTVLVWDGSVFQTFVIPGSARAKGIEVDGKIYISSAQTGVRVLDEKGLTEFIPPALIPNAGVLYMEHSASGWILCTSQGLFRYKEGKVSDFSAEATAFIRANLLSAACALPGGDIA